MKQRYILIDSENIQNRLFEILFKARKNDKVIIFYTVHHSGMLEDYMRSCEIRKNTEFVECMSGTNALDVQLIGVLSYLIQKHPRRKFVIYSDDKGFQAAVRYWQSRNVDVEIESFRVPVVGAEKFTFSAPILVTEIQEAEKKKKKKKKNKESVSEMEIDSSAEIKSEEEKISTEPVTTVVYSENANPMTDEEYINEVCHSVRSTDLATIYRVLTAGFGVENSKTAYNRFKKDADYRNIMEKLYYPEKDKRVNTLMKTLLRYNSLNAEAADEICRIISEKGMENMQQVYLSFIQRMPGTVAERQAIYKAVKPYFSLLNCI